MRSGSRSFHRVCSLPPQWFARDPGCARKKAGFVHIFPSAFLLSSSGPPPSSLPHVQLLRNPVSRQHVRRKPRRRRRRGHRRLPAAPAARGNRHPDGPRPPPPRPERHRHPAQGIRPLPHPFRRVRGRDARHAHRRARRQRGRPPGGVLRDGNRPSARATRIIPTRRNTACATGRAGDAPARAKPSAASRPARWPRKPCATLPGLEIVAYVRSIYHLEAHIDDPAAVRSDEVEATRSAAPTPRRLPRWSPSSSRCARGAIRSAGSSNAWCAGCRPGWGEPVFDRLEADLAKAMLCLPATKGFEIGSGFAAARMTGCGAQRRLRDARGPGAHGDEPFRRRAGRHFQRRGHPFPRGLQTDRNDRAAQKTVTAAGEETELAARGRHDPCVLPRAVPMVEAMAALVLVDHALRQRALGGPADVISP